MNSSRRFLCMLVFALLLTAVAGGCNTAVLNEPQPPSTEVEAVTTETPADLVMGRTGPLTPEEQIIWEQPTKEVAAEHNAKLDESTIRLLQFEDPNEGDPLLTIETSMGIMVFRLFPAEAPLAVNNITALVKEGYFDGMQFHAVMKNFYLESGAPETSPPKSSYTNSEGYTVTFATEPHLNLWNFRGALIMKNKGLDRPHSNTSEFRIVQAKTIEEEWFSSMEEVFFPQKVIEKYREIGGIPGFDKRVTVFGHLYKGYDVLDKIAAVPVNAMYQPEEDVTLLRVVITPYTKTLEEGIAAKSAGASTMAPSTTAPAEPSSRVATALPPETSPAKKDATGSLGDSGAGA